MIGQIYHVGLTVSDIDRSLAFYKDVLGLQFIGEILMEGPETDALFGRNGTKARVAYLNGSAELSMPPVELIQFIDTEATTDKGDLFKTSISELCFYTDDADKVYEHLTSLGIECMSSPRFFDFTESGFGKSKAFYFKDPDGIILEIMQPLPTSE